MYVCVCKEIVHGTLWFYEYAVHLHFILLLETLLNLPGSCVCLLERRMVVQMMFNW